MKDALKTTIYGGMLFFVSLATFVKLGQSFEYFWLDIIFFVVPAIVSFFFIVSRLLSMRREGRFSILSITRCVLLGMGIFVCLFFLVMTVRSSLDSEMFLLFNPSLLSILFVVSRVRERSWLCAGLSQSLGICIVLLVFILFLRPRGEAWMVVPILLAYALVGFCFGACVGFLKDCIYKKRVVVPEKTA